MEKHALKISLMEYVYFHADLVCYMDVRQFFPIAKKNQPKIWPCNSISSNIFFSIGRSECSVMNNTVFQLHFSSTL